MNLLLLSPEQLVGADRALVEDDRVGHVRRILRKKPGDGLRVGLRDGSVGEARIVELERERMVLEMSLSEAPPPVLDLHVGLALPRPKFIGRILQMVASMGIARLSLFSSARVEKSYWSSSVLESASIDRHLRLGLEQGGGTTMPVVSLVRDFSAFVDSVAASRDNGAVWLAHGPSELPFPRRVTAPATVVVGPEGGLLDDEVETLAAAGARPASFGLPQLRVEVAVAVCLSRCLADPG